MFDNQADTALCVIDLDTVMPGSALYDFGDAVRYGASTALEDERDLSKVSLNPELYEQFTKGFLESMGASMTKTEKALLLHSVKIMTLELATRFLADYLDGDVYFKTRSEDHNLVRARTQIRLVQDADTLMAEKIQSTIVNTIPLWKNQMVIAMGVEHSNQAAKAQHEVSELTNNLLKKNAEQLHTASVETAKESERGIVDIETLKKTNAELISTLDDVLKIQEEGRQKRATAEQEMAKMESELKAKLLELSKTSK